MLLSKITQFQNGKFITNVSNDGIYPVYGSTGIIGYCSNYLLPNDAIIIGRVGAHCGKIQYAKSPSWVTDNCIICTKISTDINYLYYLLTSLNLFNYHSGSAQPLLTVKALKNIMIPEHTIENQQHIVDTTVIPHYLILK